MTLALPTKLVDPGNSRRFYSTFVPSKKQRLSHFKGGEQHVTTNDEAHIAELDSYDPLIVVPVNSAITRLAIRCSLYSKLVVKH